MRMVALSFALAVAAAALPAAAADSFTDAGRAAARAEMGKLAAMPGRWKGGGWIEVPRAGRVEFDSEETVTEKLGGSAFVIEGVHTDKRTGAVVHHALGLLSWDVGVREYRMATALDFGRGGYFPGKLEGNRFTWTLARPNGPTQRYVITLEPDRWVEEGERSAADGAWTKFFHMELARSR